MVSSPFREWKVLVGARTHQAGSQGLRVSDPSDLLPIRESRSSAD
jgi:hypothetical protein